MLSLQSCALASTSGLSCTGAASGLSHLAAATRVAARSATPPLPLPPAPLMCISSLAEPSKEPVTKAHYVEVDEHRASNKHMHRTCHNCWPSSLWRGACIPQTPPSIHHIVDCACSSSAQPCHSHMRPPTLTLDTPSTIVKCGCLSPSPSPSPSGTCTCTCNM